MLSASTQVLLRNSDFFENKSLFFFGFITDNLKNIFSHNQVHCQSRFFDYCNNQELEFTEQFKSNSDLAIYFWGKNKKECEYDLKEFLHTKPIGTELLIVGENKSGVKSAVNMLKKVGDIAKIDSARSSSLFHFSLTSQVDFNQKDYWQTFTYQDITLKSLSGVFNSGKVDNGSRLLLETLENYTLSGKVLDLGCGCGLIGTYLKFKNSHIRITFSDIHSLSLVSTKETLVINNLEGEIVASDVFSHISQKFDYIVSNPPFHSGTETNYQAVENLIKNAKDHLSKNGKLIIVANAHLPYGDILAKSFSCFEIINQNNAFKVYQAW